MNSYYIMTGADKSKPGSGLIEEKFEAKDDRDAMDLARRHYGYDNYTLWVRSGVDRSNNIEFRYVGSTREDRKNGNSTAAG